MHVGCGAVVGQDVRIGSHSRIGAEARGGHGARLSRDTKVPDGAVNAPAGGARPNVAPERSSSRDRQPPPRRPAPAARVPRRNVGGASPALRRTTRAPSPHRRRGRPGPDPTGPDRCAGPAPRGSRPARCRPGFRRPTAPKLELRGCCAATRVAHRPRCGVPPAHRSRTSDAGGASPALRRTTRAPFPHQRIGPPDPSQPDGRLPTSAGPRPMPRGCSRTGGAGPYR